MLGMRFYFLKKTACFCRIEFQSSLFSSDLKSITVIEIHSIICNFTNFDFE